MNEELATSSREAPVWFHAALALSGGLGLLVLAFTVAGRIGFPYPLEWMEGAVLEHALRLHAIETLYAPPSAEHVPLLYPPLGYAPFALFAALFGPSLPALRAASVACSLVALVCTARVAHRLSSSRAVGLAAAGTLAIGYGYAGAFLDLVRVDAALLALLAGALDALTAGRVRIALLLFAASMLVKQHAALALGAAMLGLAIEQPEERKSVLWGGVALLALAVALELATNGSFSRYVLWLPTRHGIEPPLLGSFFLVDVCLYLPVLAVAGWLGARSLARRAREVETRTPWALTLLLVCGGLLVMGALGRAHPGGHDNVRLPALLALSVLAASACGRVVASGSRRARVATVLLSWAQLAMLYQPPSYHAPTAPARAAFAQLEATLERCASEAGGGKAVAFDYTRLAGDPFVHTMALSDLQLAGGSDVLDQAVRTVSAALASPHAPAAIAVGSVMPALQAPLERHYRECARVVAPQPPTGYVPGKLDSDRGERVLRVLARSRD